MVRSYNKQTFEPGFRNWMSKLSTRSTYIRPKGRVLFQPACELHSEFAPAHAAPTRILLYVPFKNFQRPRAAFWKPPKTDAASKGLSSIKANRANILSSDTLSVPTSRQDNAEGVAGRGRERQCISHIEDLEMERGDSTLSFPL